MTNTCAFKLRIHMNCYLWEFLEVPRTIPSMFDLIIYTLSRLASRRVQALCESFRGTLAARVIARIVEAWVDDAPHIFRVHTHDEDYLSFLRTITINTIVTSWWLEVDRCFCLTFEDVTVYPQGVHTLFFEHDIGHFASIIKEESTPQCRIFKTT
jgi:hypothetical protein